jgi:hypothetical protein
MGCTTVLGTCRRQRESDAIDPSCVKTQPRTFSRYIPQSTVYGLKPAFFMHAM